MMREIYSDTLTFITPTFLAGADQNKPEIRAPSIRGQLRWWFRVLGGTQEQECRVFGSVHGRATASAVVVRVSECKMATSTEITFRPMSDKGYLYHFARVSGNQEGVHRTQASHYLAAGSSFKLSVLLRGKLNDVDVQLLMQSVDAFVTLGSLGLRATRGCGVFVGSNIQSRNSFAEWCLSASHLNTLVFVRLASNQGYPSAEACQNALGAFLRSLRSDHCITGRNPSALGYSSGNARESSALHLRPVKVQEGYLPVVVYTDAACTQRSLGNLVLERTKSIQR